MVIFGPRRIEKKQMHFGNADHKGWLHKEGRLNSEFKKRFFLINGTVLRYYATEADAMGGKSKGELKVLSTGHVRASDKVAELLTSQTLSLCFFLGFRRYVQPIRHGIPAAELGSYCGKP